MKHYAALFLACFLFLAACGPAQAYTFRPQWVPQAQFAGYYMAVHQGFYKEAGIDLEIINGGPGVVALQEIVEGKTDFASSLLISALRMKGEGGDLMLIGQIIQKPAQLLLTKKSSGIVSVQDFAGRTLGVWPGDFQIPPKALIRKEQVRNVNIVEQGFTMDGFLSGEIDVASAMRYNEYHQVLGAGVGEDELTIINYADYDMGLPEDGVYVSSQFFSANQDACKAFMEATRKGWAYAFANKEETVKHITELANQTDFKTTEAQQATMLKEIEKLVLPDNTALSQDDFAKAVDALKRTRMLQQDIAYDAFAAPLAQQ